MNYSALKISSKEKNISRHSPVKSLIKSVFLAILFTMILFIAFAVIISLTNITESSADTMVSIATISGVIISGIIAATGVKSKGWLIGALGGLLYIFTVWIFGIISNNSAGMGTNTLIMFLLSFVFGAFGGIIGINLKSK